MFVHQTDVPKIRPMRQDDLTEIFAIEVAAHPFPWTRQILSDCISVGYQCWLVEHQEHIVGFAVMSSAANECHLLNICTDPTKRRKGYARLLLRHMIGVAKQKMATTMFLEVRVSNTGALSLYEQEGFNQIDTRKDYYPAVDGREDALVLARHISQNTISNPVSMR